MKFRTTRKEIRISDEGGYAFDVVLTFDEESGWAAHAALGSEGSISEEAALRRLADAAGRLVRMLEEKREP